MDVSTDKNQYGAMYGKAVKVSGSIFLWAEDFLDRKLAVYSKNINEISDYDVIKSRLVSASLILNISKRNGYMRYIAGCYDAEKRTMYIAEADFRVCQKALYKEVLNAIQLARSKRYQCLISKPEDILDLSNLKEEKQRAYLKAERQKPAETLSDEEVLLRNKKQSLLDNPKMLYYYAENAENYHDKSCMFVRQIRPAQFRASEKAPEGKVVCPKCRRQLYLRIACFPNTKQMSVCDRILRDAGINDGGLRRFVMDGKLKFHASDIHSLRVTGKEDQWIIEKTEEGGWRLLHNNYVKTMERERYITDGFHDQGMYGFSMFELLKYIQNYTWEGHLQAKEKRQQRRLETQNYTENICPAPSEAENGSEKLPEAKAAAAEAEVMMHDKEKWYRRLGKWLKKYFSA